MARFWSEAERAHLEQQTRQHIAALRDRDELFATEYILKTVGDPRLYRAVAEHVARALAEGRIGRGALCQLLAECHASTTRHAGQYFSKTVKRMLAAREPRRLPSKRENRA